MGGSCLTVSICNLKGIRQVLIEHAIGLPSHKRSAECEDTGVKFHPAV